MVLEHGADERECLQELVQHLHLLVELAEDDPPVADTGLVALAEQHANLVKLAADLGEFGTRPPEGLLLAGLDVDLGVHADLAEAQQNAEHGQRIGLAFHGLCHAPLALKILVDSLVYSCLVFVGKIEAAVFNDGLGRHRQTCGGLATVVGASKIAVADPCLVIRAPGAGTACRKANEFQICDDILHAVDDGSGRQSPLVGRRDLQDGLGLLRAGIADRLGLVQDDAVVFLALAEFGAIGDLVIVGDVDDRTVRAGIHLADPLSAEGRGGEQIDSALLGCVLPLLLDGERGDDQGLLGLPIDNKTEGLEGLAEPHFVAEDAPAHDDIGVLGHGVALGFLLEHPVDTGLLVGGVGGTLPDGGKGCHYVCS